MPNRSKGRGQTKSDPTGPPGWGLGRGLITLSHKKRIITETRSRKNSLFQRGTVAVPHRRELMTHGSQNQQDVSRLIKPLIHPKYTKMSWAPEGKRRRGPPKTTWRRALEKERARGRLEVMGGGTDSSKNGKCPTTTTTTTTTAIEIYASEKRDCLHRENFNVVERNHVKLKSKFNSHHDCHKTRRIGKGPSSQKVSCEISHEKFRKEKQLS